MTTSPSAEKFGPIVPDTPAKPPTYNITLKGQHVTMVPVHVDHASDLYEQVSGPSNVSLFDYLFDEPPASVSELQASFRHKRETSNPWTYTILLNATGKAVGNASLMRMDLSNRVIEIGSILYAPCLQRTAAATEVQYLFASYVFDTLGFRRYEWKCNALNAPSKRAAVRLGFVYEGTFRQHMVARGRNRDTAWFAVIDGEWPVVKKGYEAWLGTGNFDAEGKQKRSLEECRAS